MRQQRWLGPAMFIPAILYIVILVGVPFVMAFVYSVGDVKVGSVGYHFVGLHNFVSVLQSPTFRGALKNSCIFTITSQIIVLIGANILALALKDAFPGRRFMRFLILLPWVAPVSIGSIGWKWILDSVYSVVNWVLVRMHFVKEFDAPVWLGIPKLAIISAGLTAIPRDIPEAAAVDGAGFFRTLFQITIPMMLPIINVAMLFGVIFTFTDMTVIYILTRGGPYDMTQVIPSEAFFTGVLGSDLAEGATISIFLVPLLVVAAYFMLRTAHRAEVT